MKKNDLNLSEENWCAALSYVFVGLLWYLLDDKMRKSSFVKFHVKQALVLLIAVLLLEILSTVLFFIFFVWWLVGLFLFIIGLLGVIYALDNQEKPLPLLGSFAKKFTF